MKTINSLSGGKTSSFMAVHYPCDYNIFSLITTIDKNCMFKDKKIRQIVSDKIGKEFIGTLEEDTIIYTILELEQFIGKKIDWVSGKSFDEIIIRKDKKYLPNVVQRFCTTEMKLNPINEFWFKNIKEVVNMNIGYRANEINRKETMIEKTNKKGNLEYKFIVGNSKNGRNKWQNFEVSKPKFPLIENNIFKDKIYEFWKDKKVPFAYMNNCVGCFHRNPILLKYMSIKEPIKFDWFIDAEKDGCGKRTFKNGISYKQIKEHKLQGNFFDNDFNDCDSGYCGI